MRLNPDKETVRLIKEGLKKKRGYCPCKISEHPDNRCPCKEMREKQECHCKLYIK